MQRLRESSNSCYYSLFLPSDNRLLMHSLVKPILPNAHNPSIRTTATLTSVSQYLQTTKNIGQRLSLFALFIASLLAPLKVQAALSQEIEAALARAHLSAADISIVITPLGDKNANLLPSAIQVIDNNNSKNKAADSKASIKISFSPLLSHHPDIAHTPASTTKLGQVLLP